MTREEHLKKIVERCELAIESNKLDAGIETSIAGWKSTIAAMERFKGDDEQRKFSMALEDISKPANYKWQLTALDWAIAFARTAKIWRYKV